MPTHDVRRHFHLSSASPILWEGTNTTLPIDSYLTKWLKDSWTEFGLDSVSLSTYDYLLSYPDPGNPNKIYLYDQNNQQQFVSKHEEDVLRKEDAHENFIHAFNAYAPAGDVSGELVYVNYGR